MLLRTIAILLSLSVHGLIGYAIWPRLHNEELEILDFGTGQDIELMPQGMVLDTVANRGDSVESLATPDVVPMDERKPPPEASSSVTPMPLRDVSGGAPEKSAQDVAMLPQQKPAPQSSPVAPPTPLHDAPDAQQAQNTEDIPAIEPRKPSTQPPTVTSSDPLIDLPDDAGRQITPDVAPVREQAPAAQRPLVATAEQLRDDASKVESRKPDAAATVEQQRPAPAHPTTKPSEQLDAIAAPQKSAVEQIAAQPTETPLPTPLKAPSSGKPGDLPPLDQLKESKVTQVDKPSPPTPMAEQQPDTKEVEAQPEQVAIVTEESSATVKTGGEARVVGIYLGQINDRVQHSKVNPRSRQTGVVVLKYTIGTDGALLSREVMSSSKYRVLDEAALAALDRATPFPPIPPEVSLKPMTFTQPFKFIVR